MSSTILNRLLYLMAEKAADVEAEKLRLMAVVSPEDFETVNDCVLEVSGEMCRDVASIYRFAQNMAVEHGWTKQDYIDWAKRWRVT